MSGEPPRWLSALIGVVLIGGMAALALCSQRDQGERRSRHMSVLNDFLLRVHTDQSVTGTDPVGSTKSAIALLAAASDSREVYSTGAILSGGASITCVELEVATKDGKRAVVVSVYEADGKPPAISRVALKPPCRCKKNSGAVCD